MPTKKLLTIDGVTDTYEGHAKARGLSTKAFKSRYYEGRDLNKPHMSPSMVGKMNGRRNRLNGNDIPWSKFPPPGKQEK